MRWVLVYGWPGFEIYYNPIYSDDFGLGTGQVIKDYSSTNTDVIVGLYSDEPDIGWNDAWGAWWRNCSVSNYVGGLDKMWFEWISAIQFDFHVEISELDQGTYDIYIYGHGDSTAPENSGKYQLLTWDGGFNVQYTGPYYDYAYLTGTEEHDYGTLETTTTGTNLCDPWTEDLQYVVFRDVEITSDANTVIIHVFATPNYSHYDMSTLSGIQIVPVD